MGWDDSERPQGGQEGALSWEMWGLPRLLSGLLTI